MEKSYNFKLPKKAKIKDTEGKDIDKKGDVQILGVKKEKEQIYEVEQGSGQIWETNMPELERRIKSLKDKVAAIVIPAEPKGEEDRTAYDQAISQKERYLNNASEFQALLDEIKKL